MTTSLLIVTRDQPALYAYLARDFAGDEDVTVILDRRIAERRRVSRASADERRRADRRVRCDVSERMAAQGFAVVHAEPHDSLTDDVNAPSSSPASPRVPAELHDSLTDD